MEVYYLNNPDLRNLLKIYDQKRLAAEIECENRVNELYANISSLLSSFLSGVLTGTIVIKFLFAVLYLICLFPVTTS